MNLAILWGEFNTPSSTPLLYPTLLSTNMISHLNPLTLRSSGPIFGWFNKHTIEKTFHKTTQWAISYTNFPMRKHFKSRFPVFNIPRQSEEVATDTIFSATPAIDSGVTMAQSFVGKRTLVTDVYPLKSQKKLSNTRG